MSAAAMNRFTLDSPIEDEGANLSIGQVNLLGLLMPFGALLMFDHD